MTNMSKMLIGTAGLAAALTIASPAAAQQPYPYAKQNSGVVGAIINSVTGGGYGQYPQGNYGYGQVNERAAVGMCAAAAEQRINGNYRGQPGNGYNNGYANNGYQQGYANGYNGQGAPRPRHHQCRTAQQRRAEGIGRCQFGTWLWLRQPGLQQSGLQQRLQYTASAVMAPISRPIFASPVRSTAAAR